ncbi:MAG: MFS transporter [Victivallaceae bacterium]|nr:MFS transporter [Victivallaceae bacterium]
MKSVIQNWLLSLSPTSQRMVLLGIIYVGFVSLGLPDTILGVTWDPIHREFCLPIQYAGIITVLLTICSAISAFLSGAILRRTGTGKLLMVCGFVTGGAMLGTAFSPAWWGILCFAIPLGFGQGAVDTGMNFYVAKHYTSRDMSWLHCCWGIGASGAPMLATALLDGGFSWRWGYGVIAAIQLALAVIFLFTLGLWREQNNSAPDDQASPKLAGRVTRDLRFFGCPIMMFLYCGIEFSMGLWCFAFLTECRGFSNTAAGYAVAGYWGMLTLGRFLIGFAANRIGNTTLIRFSMITATAGALLLMIPGPTVMMLAAVGLTGFAFASFYPSMMHAAPERFDDATAATVIGYQGGAGMLGGALIPAAFGAVAGRIGFGLLPIFIAVVAILIFAMQFKIDGIVRPRS